METFLLNIAYFSVGFPFVTYVFPLLRLFSSYAFFYVRLRTCAQYASMNEFTCSEHSILIRISRKNAALDINPYARFPFVTYVFPLLRTFSLCYARFPFVTYVFPLLRTFFLCYVWYEFFVYKITYLTIREMWSAIIESLKDIVIQARGFSQLDSNKIILPIIKN